MTPLRRSPALHRAALAASFTAVVLAAYAAGAHHTPTPPPVAIAASPTEVSSADYIPVVAPPLAVQNDIMPAVAKENEELPKVRQAVRDLIKEKHPNSRVEGVSTLPLGRSGLYLAGADTLLSGDRESRRIVDTLVRLYVRRNGSTYWRAESLGPEQASSLLIGSSLSSGR